jgi:hypothetical protein
MKKNRSKTCQKLSVAALLLGGISLASAQIADNNLNSFDSNATLAPNGTPAGHSNNNGTYGGGIWYGSSIVDWDGTQDNTGNGGGSAHITGTWGSDQANSDSPYEIYLGSSADQLYYIPSPLTISAYLNVQFDFKWDNSSTMTLDEFNNMSLVPTNYLNYGDATTHLNAAGQLEVDFAKNGSAAFLASTNVPHAATNGWVHFTFPINPATANEDGSMGILLRPANYFSTASHLTNDLTSKFWIDNIFLKGTAAPPPPPVLTINNATPGLNFVQGSISGEFDRQNIITANGANSSANYSWAGATVGSPVTYSFNISQDTAPDINFHIFFYQTAGAGGASAPDYNQPNVLILQIGPATNNTAASVSLTWKTNSPNSGTIATSLLTNSPVLAGNWQLRFTSATAGTVLAPGGYSYPFTLDPSVATLIANPITVNFGINPSANTNTILGERIVVSQIGISGVDPISVDTATTDNFLADSSLDTNSWTVNAHFNASILFEPTNSAYEVNWTLPDNGFSLQQNSSLTNIVLGPSVSQPVITMPPGRKVVIPQSTLPPGNVAYFNLIKRTFTKLQVLLPGETNAPNTPTGKVGTPAVHAGNIYTVTINAVDATWNLVNAPGDSISVTTTDGNDLLIEPGSLVSGTTTGQIDFGDPGSDTITATDTTNGAITAGTDTVTVLL